MKILVTGGAGFIGSHLVKSLVAEGHDVVVIDNLSTGKRENVPFTVPLIVGDIRDIKFLPGVPTQIDAVYHLAAHIDVRESVKDPIHNAAVNVMGTIAVLNYAADAGAQRFVFTSTGGAMYGATDIFPTPETEPCQASSPYGISKYSAEQYVMQCAKAHNMAYSILRFGNVYGPGQDGSRECGVISIFTQALLDQKPITIFGDGEQTRDYVFVGDVARALLATLTKGDNQVMNIASGHEVSVNALVLLLANASNSTPVIHYAPARPGEERRSCLSIEKAQRELEWNPQTSIEQGIQATYNTARVSRMVVSRSIPVVA